jgi:hypothetical protein
VYSLTGTLAAKFTGNHTDVPVNLAPGTYIIQAGNGSAKLPVVSNSPTGTSAQPALKTKTPTAPTPPATSPQSGTGAKIYWTIKAGNNTLSVEIPDVVSFRFTADNSIIFTLKDGNTVELTDYQGIEFSIEPAPITTASKWDLEKTFKFGGAAYFRNWGTNEYSICMVAVAQDYVIAEDILKKIASIKILKKEITNPRFWNEKLTIFYASEDNALGLAQFYKGFRDNAWYIVHDIHNINTEWYAYEGINFYNFNNYTPSIPATFKLNPDGSLTMEVTDVRDGKGYTHTFPAP